MKIAGKMLFFEDIYEKSVKKKGICGKNPKTKVRNLLGRFTEDKEKIMRFLTDLRISFE